MFTVPPLMLNGRACWLRYSKMMVQPAQVSDPPEVLMEEL
jgi:hypothetical protein